MSPGWLVELSEGRSLCILRLHCLAQHATRHCLSNSCAQGPTRHPHDSTMLPAGSGDPWLPGGCQHTVLGGKFRGLQRLANCFSVQANLLPASHNTSRDCPSLPTCTPDTPGSCTFRIAHDKQQKSTSASMVPEHCNRPCSHKRSQADNARGSGCLVGWNPPAAYLAGSPDNFRRRSGART